MLFIDYYKSKIIEDNFFSEGDSCIDLIDSDYEIITNDFQCRDIDYQVSYNIRLLVADESAAFKK